MHEKYAAETRRRSHDKGENLVYIFFTMRERGWFPELDSSLKAELAEALYVVGRDKLDFGRTGEARSSFWQCFLLSHRRAGSGKYWPLHLSQALRSGRLRDVWTSFRKITGFGQKRSQKNLLGDVGSIQ